MNKEFLNLQLNISINDLIQFADSFEGEHPFVDITSYIGEYAEDQVPVNGLKPALIQEMVFMGWLSWEQLEELLKDDLEYARKEQAEWEA